MKTFRVICLEENQQCEVQAIDALHALNTVCFEIRGFLATKNAIYHETEHYHILGSDNPLYAIFKEVSNV